MLNIVSGKPVPAGETSGAAYATSTVGPARGYAKAAAKTATDMYRVVSLLGLGCWCRASRDGDRHVPTACLA